MSEQYDVIVIGSGIGGLTAALTCARAKRSVLVLEAGKQFGGYCNPFARKHFHFDPGIHYIGEAGPGGGFRALLDKLELGGVDFCELDPEGFDHYVFPGYSVKNCVGHERFRDRLAADFPKERRALDRFFSLVSTIKLTQNVRSPRDALRLLKGAPPLLRWARSSLKDLLDATFEDPTLKAAVAAPCGDLGSPPSKVSALMHLAVLAHYSNGAYFPKGGSAGIRDPFVEALKSEGAVLRRNSRVETILVEGGRAVGVRMQDGKEHRAEVLISNAQATATYEMVGLEKLSRRLRRKVKRTELSPASFVLFMGVEGSLPTSHIGSANIWSYDTVDIDSTYSPAAMNDPFGGGSFFLTVPTNKDPESGLAPRGKQTVELVALTAPGGRFKGFFESKSMKRGEAYQALKEEIADYYIEKAERHLPGLRESIVLKEVATPATNYSYTLSPEGNIYGPAHTVDQALIFRFGTKTPIEGLFLCGSSSMSAGVVSCASSGRIAGKQALSVLEKRAARRGLLGLPLPKLPKLPGRLRRLRSAWA